VLRYLFGEPHRVDSGELLKANQALVKFMESLDYRERKHQITSQRLRYLEIWTEGFLRSLDELEQSKFCSERFGKLIEKSFVDDMMPNELDNYRRHHYFYKNALVRIFSTLDKLGYFLNDLLDLQTERVKERFSYFTVLRRMQVKKLHTELERTLSQLKTGGQDIMAELRTQRNIEVHSMNGEILDDLQRVKRTPHGKMPVENVKANLELMNGGFDLVCRTLTVIFTYIRTEVNPG
jgi:hypothetical protein